MSEGTKGYIEKTIEEWVKREVAFPDRKLRGRCTKVVLRHLGVNRKEQGDVCSLPVKLEDGAEGEFEPLLHQVADAAQGDADDLKAGVQLYALYAYFELDKQYVPRKVFRVSANDTEIDRDVRPSEPPNAEGLVSQTMRHLEVVLRNQTISVTNQLQTQQRENERLATMNEKFMQSQIDMMVLMQDTLDNAHARRLKEKEAETSIAMKESAIAALAPLLPVLINRLAGTQVVPEDNKSLMMLAGLIDNLGDDQQAKLLSILNDSQRTALAEIMRVFEQGKVKYLEGQKKLMSQIRPGASNELPPPSTDTDFEPAPLPLPTTMTIAERTKLPETPSSDPKIQQLEADGAAFVNRFRDFFGAPEPKKEG